MAKFFARLVVLGGVSMVTVILLVLVLYTGPQIGDSNLQPQHSRLLRGADSFVYYSAADNDTKQYRFHGNHQLGRITLATDDENTHQVWGWQETREAVDMCGKIDYSRMSLPGLSVVICFHDKEHISNLLHTVHSVVQRTPPHLLKEVILVDDHSNNDDLGQILEVYADTVFHGKVQIYRSPERLGLIRARLKGIRLASAEVVAVMDSHVEVQPRWAEPLLYEIQVNPKTLAASYIDWMEKKDDHWEYKHSGTTWKTYFDWTFVFGWQTMSDAEIRARKSLIEPIKAPVIIGTIWAINREFFESVGAFDPGMQLWGGENLDLPVRVWLCGGRVINHPCSRGGHMESHGSRDYRSNSDFTDSKNTNYKRFAEVWAGEFKKYFYMYTPEAQAADAGDISSRIRLRSMCTHNFTWYLQEIFPELGVPDRDSLAWGMLRNAATNLCLDTKYTQMPGVATCGSAFNRQGFFWTKDLHLRLPIHILNYRDLAMFGQEGHGLYVDEYISNHKSTQNNRWLHWKDGLLMNVDHKLCLEATNKEFVVFADCDPQSYYQKWTFEHYNADYNDLQTAHSVDDTINAILKQFKQEFPQNLKEQEPKLQRQQTKNAPSTRKTFAVPLKRWGNAKESPIIV